MLARKDKEGSNSYVSSAVLRRLASQAHASFPSPSNLNPKPETVDVNPKQASLRHVRAGGQRGERDALLVCDVPQVAARRWLLSPVALE